MDESDTESEPSILQNSGSGYIPSENEDSNSANPVVSDDNSSPETNQKSRKRKRNLCKKEDRKIKRSLGKEYITAKGKKVSGKTFSNPTCQCRLKCNEVISENERKKLFENFYAMGNFQTQNAYICGLCKQSTPATHRVRDGTRGMKGTTIQYFLQLAEKNVHVCKKYFLKTFQISDGRVFRALKKVRDGQEPGCDMRGKKVPVNKTDDVRLNIVKEHIASFPAYESHYTRTHNPNRKYLSETLNIRLMYTMYKEHCSNLNAEPLSESMYRRVFNFDFNLHFHQPHKDTCVKWDILKIKISACENEEEKNDIENSKSLHLRKADLAREKMKEAKDLSRSNPNVYAFTFDLQKALPFPTLTCSLAYYKRNMYVYNLGCHDLSNGSAYMHVWSEVTASRGSQEISSCVIEHLRHRISSDTEHVIMFSDSCGGQNRNIKVALAIMNFIQQENCPIKVLDHKFMVSGHSFLPNDADFGIIEQHAKGKVIYEPRDWYNIIAESKKKKPTFMVKVMAQNEIKSTDALEKAITRRKVNVSRQKVSWLRIQWLRYTKDDTYKIFYKETLNDDMPFDVLDITPAKKGKRCSSLANVTLEPLYSSPRSVTPAKKRDMLDLLPFIPPINHCFYTQLQDGSPSAEDDTPIVDRVSESESESEHETV